MEIRSTGIEDLLEVIPQSFQDNRGWFLELLKTTSQKEWGPPHRIVQDNYSKSETGISWNDPQLKIDWRIERSALSEMNMQLPSLEELLGKSLISPKV